MKTGLCSSYKFLYFQILFFSDREEGSRHPQYFFFQTAAITKIPYYMALDARRTFSPTAFHVMPPQPCGVSRAAADTHVPDVAAEAQRSEETCCVS